MPLTLHQHRAAAADTSLGNLGQPLCQQSCPAPWWDHPGSLSSLLPPPFCILKRKCTLAFTALGQKELLTVAVTPTQDLQDKGAASRVEASATVSFRSMAR